VNLDEVPQSIEAVEVIIVPKRVYQRWQIFMQPRKAKVVSTDLIYMHRKWVNTASGSKISTLNTGTSRKNSTDDLII
jgi:hypothetical protein